MPHTIPVWRHADGTYTSDIAKIEFESEGSFVPQDAANTEMERWYTMIRNNAGAGTAFQYLGGDVTDGFRTSGGDVAWIGADWLSGTTIDGDDTYAGVALPACRSGLIIEDVDGIFFQQFHNSGSTGNWIDAIANGGQAANTLWWPIAGLNDGGTNKVFCWHVNGTIPPPYGTLLDVHLVSLNVFGLYSSFVDTNLGATDNFWVDGAFRDTTFTYIYGEQFVPDYDADTAGTGLVPNYGQGSNILSHYTLKRVARVTNGQLGTVANWTFWNGTTWVAGASNAVPMVDDLGNQIHGDAGVKKIADGHYILAAHQLIDTHLSVYRSANPQGPWTMISRVPTPTQGQTFNGGGIQIGQLVKVLSVPPNTPAGYSMAIISRNMLHPTEPMSLHNIRRYAPQFVVIPNT